MAGKKGFVLVRLSAQLWIITQMEHRKTENHLSVEGRGKMEMAFHAWRASFGVRGRRALSLARSPGVSPPLAAAGQVDRQSRNMWNRLLDLEVILDGGRESIVCVRMWRVVRREP